MRKPRQFLYTVLCLVMTLALLAGCATASPAATSAPAATTAPAATVEATATPTAEPALEPVTINWYVVNTPQPDTDKVLEAFNKMLASKTKLNATLKLNVLDWGTYQDRINVLLQSGEPMDLMFTCGWINSFTALAGRDALYPLDDLLAKYGQDIYKYVPAKYFEATRIGGKIRAVPDYQGYPQIKGLDFRADLVDKYNFDYKSVKTPADLEAFFQTLRDKEPGVTPFLPGIDSGILTLSETNGKYDGLPEGIWYDVANNNLVNSLDIADNLYARLHDWYKKGFIAKDAASRTVFGDEIKTGNYAVWINPSYMDDGAKSSKDYGFKVYSIPYKTQSPITTGMVQVCLTAIPSTSKNPDRAMMLLNAVFADQELYNTLVYGVEGTHWNWNAEKTFVVPVDNSAYASPIGYQLGSAFRKYPNASETKEVLQYQESLNDSVPPSPILGFTFDTSSVKNECAQIDAIWAEVGPLLYTGTNDPATVIPQLKDRVSKAGFDKVMAECQKQLDAWKTANGK